MQTMREVVDFPGNLPRLVQRVAGQWFCAGRNRLVEELEIHRQQADLLADVVVQFAGDPRTLRVLGVEQPRPEVVDAPGTAAQRFFAAAQSIFGRSALPSLRKQAGDEKPLRHQHCRTAQHVDPGPLPHRRLRRSFLEFALAAACYPGIALGRMDGGQERVRMRARGDRTEGEGEQLDAQSDG